MTSTQIRQKAREVLDNLPGKYKLFCLPIILLISLNIIYFIIFIRIHLFLYYAYVSESPIGNKYLPIVILIILSILLTSASFNILKVLRLQKKEVSFSDLKLIFSQEFLTTFIFTILHHIIYLLLWSLITIGGCLLVLIGAIQMAFYSSMTSILFLFNGFIVYVIGLAVLTIKSYNCSMTEFLLYDAVTSNTSIEPSQLMEQSKQLMEGNKLRFFYLHLSFIGWILLTLLTFGIASVYTLPYLVTAQAVFYEDLKHQQALEKQSANTLTNNNDDVTKNTL